MPYLPFLKEFVIILAAAVLIIFISNRLRLPSIVGFLLTGMLIGPFGLNLVAQVEVIEVFAEIGVVMLLFFIGLEFSVPHLKGIRREILCGGGSPAMVTTAVVFALVSLGGFSPSEKVFFGFLIALSSTAIVLKILADRGELETPHGKLSVGILLFQDLFIVPMIVVTPLLAGGQGLAFGDVAIRFLISVAAVVVVFYAARYVMPRVLHQIARTRVREAFLLGSLLVCLLMAGVTATLGFSYALGAFIAGLIISESEYSHQVVAEIVSFRDLFTSLFFISVGMLLNLDFVLNNLMAVVGISGGIFIVKAAIVFAVVLALKFPFRTATIAALGLAQIGEFSFVLAKVGQSFGLLNETLYQHFLGASILTMIATPLLIRVAPTIAERTQGVLPFRLSLSEHEQELVRGLSDHVVIVGYGVNGQNVARVLRETGIPYLILEANGETVQSLRREGLPVVFGDVTRRDILNLCNIEQANTIVFAIADPRATRTAVRLARSLNPHIHVIVRTRLVSEVDELSKIGANEVIPEEFETSIEIFTRVLEQFHIPRNVVNAQIQVIRDENYRMLRGLPVTGRALDRVAQLLAAGTSDTFLVTDDSIAANRTIRELHLRKKTGATLIAIVRGEKPFINPNPDFRIEPSDCLVLVGNHASMDKAFEFLSERPSDHEETPSAKSVPGGKKGGGKR